MQVAALLIEVFATRTERHEENLATDFTDDTDFLSHKKAQKTRRKLDVDWAEFGLWRSGLTGDI